MTASLILILTRLQILNFEGGRAVLRQCTNTKVWVCASAGETLFGIYVIFTDRFISYDNERYISARGVNPHFFQGLTILKIIYRPQIQYPPNSATRNQDRQNVSYCYCFSLRLVRNLFVCTFVHRFIFLKVCQTLVSAKPKVNCLTITIFLPIHPLLLQYLFNILKIHWLEACSAVQVVTAKIPKQVCGHSSEFTKRKTNPSTTKR